MRQIEFLDAEIAEVERLIALDALDWPRGPTADDRPGRERDLAASFLAAIGDIGRFENPRKLVGYLGLDPRVRQSGSGPATHGRISKQGSVGPGTRSWRPVGPRSARPVARVLSADPCSARPPGGRRRRRPKACVPVLVFAHPRAGLRLRPALADAQEAAPARADGRCPQPEGHQARRLGRQRAMREAERDLALQAETAYQRTVARLARRPSGEGGRERDTGTRIFTPSKRQAARQGISPRALRFSSSSPAPTRTLARSASQSRPTCLEYLAASRWPEGFACPGCGGRRAWVLERRHLWECGECHQQTSVTAGTVMHGTRTPLRLWFWAAYLVATHTPGDLGQAAAAPARPALRDGLADAAEAAPGDGRPRARAAHGGGRGRRDLGRRGRGGGAGASATGKTLVGVAVEVRGTARGACAWRCSTPRCRHARLGERDVAPGAIVHTDGWKGYGGLAQAGYHHRPRRQHRRGPTRAHPTPRPSRDLQPQDLAARHPPRRLRQSICRSTSTSSSSATTAAAPRWPPSRPCSGSGPSTSRRPTARSPDAPQPERTG